MELEKIERLKELINCRDVLLADIEKIDDKSSIAPQELTFEWGSGYSKRINIPHGTYCKIKEFLLNLLNEELENTNKWILKL
jgi:hypothetical protein